MSKADDLVAVKKFKKFYRAIPDSKWTSDNYARSGRYCALGHLGERSSKGTDSGTKLRLLFVKHLGRFVPSVNDGLAPEFDQPKPKARIMAALDAIEQKLRKKK